MLRKYFGKAVIRSRMMLEKCFNSILMMLIMLHIRNEAHRHRREIVKLNGKRVVTRQIKKTIKEYCKRRFGKKSYWPQLATNTEARGEFVEGWIPYDYLRFKFLPKLNPLPAGAMDFKTYDYQLFGDFAVRPLYLYINDMYYDADLKFVDPDKVMSFFSNYEGDIVIKEDTSWGGLQVRVIPASEYTLDSVKKDLNYVIQPYIKQHENLSKVYPDSVNSIRVNTFLKKDGTVEVKCIWLRFGSDGSRVDNVTSGGSYLFIHLDGKSEKMDYDIYTYQAISDRHKNTGFVYSELEIPKFDEVLDKCKEAHLKFPYGRLIAWDVCVDSEGEPRLLEWNLQNPDFISTAPLWGPYWPDDNDI
jgi:hypothetical protein